MIIQTRYRDIPLEEVRKCAPQYPEESWSQHRGNPVRLVSRNPAEPGYRHCQGISFKTDKNHPRYGQFWACEHIAEIGD